MIETLRKKLFIIPRLDYFKWDISKVKQYTWSGSMKNESDENKLPNKYLETRFDPIKQSISKLSYTKIEEKNISNHANKLVFNSYDKYPNDKWIYDIDKSNKEIKASVFKDGTFKHEEKYHFNKFGKLESKQTNTEKFIKHKRRFEYDNHLRLLKTVTNNKNFLTLRNEMVIYNYETDFQYKEDNRGFYEKIHQIINGKKNLILEKKTEWSFNTDQNIVVKTHHLYFKKEHKAATIFEVFDKDFNLIERYGFNDKDQLFPSKLIHEYKYDKNHNWTSRKTYQKNDSGTQFLISLTKREIEYISCG